MRKIDKPWGHELIWAETGKYVDKILHVMNGFCLSRQYHDVKDETIMVKSGILTLETDRESPRSIFKFNDGEVYHIPSRTIHRMAALDGDVDILEVSTPELDDVVRLEDNYGRT